MRCGFALGFVLVFGLRLAFSADDAPKFSPAQVEFFEKQVQPILQARCLKCHGGEEKIKGDLRLTSRAAVLQGGDSGPAVNLQKPEASVLVEAINYKGFEMPPSGKLPAAEIAVLTKWVQDGLPWNAKSEPTPEPKKPAGIVIDDAARNYWAYRPVKRLAPPKVKDAAWVKNPVDAFVLAKVEAARLKPVGKADPVALIRRVAYDLTGLPPKPEDVAAFVADPSPAAYEKLIDRLLESPQYGEKWGRHWLDVVRYAESNGYERDNPKPFAWRYRDYVVNAFNADKPYDRFLQEQLAGDELDSPTAESIIATGYYRLGIWDDEPADRPLAKYDVLDGVVSTTAQAVLAMSANCCRCHDHKKDPLPQRDYYRLLAFFRDVSDQNGKNTRKLESDQDRVAAAKVLAERQATEARLYGEIYRLEQEFKTALAKRGIAAEDAVESDLVDLSYRFYRDTWDKLPDFDALKHEDVGTIADGFLSLDPASRPEAIGLVFEGKLKVPAAGEYTFDVDATEGVRLIVGGKRVVDQAGKGRHAVKEFATLAAGLIPLRVEYFNSTAKPKLSVAWSGPGMPRRFLSDDGPAKTAGKRVFVADSRKNGQSWSYTFEKPADGWQQPAFDAKSWKTGPGGFGTRGTPGAIVRTEWRSADIWLRTSFDAASPPTQLSLVLHHDEDCEVYLNGVRIFAAKGFLRDYEPRPLDPEALRAMKVGQNVLAVHCRQTGGGQYIDVSLVEGRGGSTEKVQVAQLIRQHPDVWQPAKSQRHAELVAQLDQARKLAPPEGGLEVMCVEEAGRSATNVLLRGNPALVGEKVEPGYPTVLGFPDPTVPAREGRTSGKRRVLAEWLTNKSNPLTARVFVNRLWQHHFGRGIVPTPNDFGLLGEQPSHPELLDWLASEFMAGDWRIKRMHKLLLLSATYQLSSRASDDGLKLDPANRLFWRFNMRRLTAEELRDSILTVSGQLNLKAGGPPIYPPIPREVLAGQSRPGAGWSNSPPEEASRRSVYIHVKRSLLVPLLADHDSADTDSSCPVRYSTTVATQALNLLNSQFSQEQAAVFARRLAAEFPDRLPDQIRRAILLTTSRQPTDDEIARDAAFVERLQSGGLKPAEAIAYYCLLALNTNEFIYLD